MINANQGVSTTNTSGHGLGGDLKCATSTFTVNAALTTGQVIPMLAVPAGARIVDAKLSLEGINGGNFSLGDSTAPKRFIASATVLDQVSMQQGGLYLYKASTSLNITVGGTPAGTSGVVKLAVLYVVDGVSPRDA